MLEVVENSDFGKFILLADFEDSFNRGNFNVPIELINNKIISPFQKSIKEIIPELTIIKLADIRADIARKVDERYFVITMDDGTYFNHFDFNFNISRTAYEIETAATGPYYRMPRTKSRNIISQGQLLFDKYNKYGNRKPIALCDDGVGSGNSLKKIIHVLSELKIHPTKIFTYLNPNKISSVGTNDITTIKKVDENYNWLSERDLFWGIPRSGVSCKLDVNDKTYFVGLPYTISKEMINLRIANFKEKTEELRKVCINMNILFWKEIENHNKSRILIGDVERLKGFGEYFNLCDERLIDYLEKVNHENFSL